MTNARWVSPASRPLLRDRMASALGISPITAQVLINRGVCDEASARSFMQPSLGDLRDPLAIPSITRAAEVLQRAVLDGDEVTVYGDYDVDGVCATALMLKLFSMLGVCASYYIPQRISEGYGLNAAALRKLKERGSGLVLTVDCGTNAVEEARLAASLGMRLIITDHHEPGDELPEACAIVNPHVEEENGFDKGLSGVGVAFKLAYAVLSRLGKERSDQVRSFLAEAMALVALGTVADVVPLRGENRALTQFGLTMLRETEVPGIQALVSVCGLSGRSLDTEDLAFRLGPRINAAGRLGTAVLALELLTTSSRERADEIAAKLDRTNRERQRIEAKTLEQAFAQIEDKDMSSQYGLVLSHPEWHAGVIGIVASKIVDVYHRPTVLIAEREATCQGSARSIPGFNVADALRSCSSCLLSFGGHSQAGGLRLRRERLEDFACLFLEEARRSLADEDLVPMLSVDAEISLGDVTSELAVELQRLAPFGKGNPPPILAAQGVLVGGEPRRIGRSGKHLSFYARQGERALRVVAFGMGELASGLDGSAPIDVAFTPQINTFRGKQAVELIARDIRIQT